VRPDAMNDPHENLDHDPFADDAQRRSSRLRRDVARRARLAAREGCADAPFASASRLHGRQARPCPEADRGPLR
jgi:hypothetical protein